MNRWVAGDDAEEVSREPGPELALSYINELESYHDNAGCSSGETLSFKKIDICVFKRTLYGQKLEARITQIGSLGCHRQSTCSTGGEK